ncbi:MAG TPA: DNA methyltransferase [Patescibacteria group bacterium]|nr:DNA methyltransferase [Patescibacteria group bacterium]
MPLSWNEIKTRAIQFSKEWEDETSEDAEAKSFWDGFFNVFGISRRRTASFEKPVKKLDNKQGFIDLLWKGVILVEHKSRGRDLDKAFQQAKDYFPGLKEHELPKYILVSDFAKFRLYDIEQGKTDEFALADFVNNVHLFGFIAGYEKRTYKEEDPVNIAAAELMGKLHDRLEEVGYKGHALEVYLVRLLFCLFADDTGIFEKGIFAEYIDKNTREDGSDLAMHLAQLFQTLNQPRESRSTILDERLQQFPYVNGKLFEEVLPIAAFDSKMREMLYDACGLNWSKISPAIFGSMFQAVMNPKERRNLGAHYTSEKNILKVIKPLFLDDLHAEFEKAKGNRNKLRDLHKKIAELRFLDPACGCGNFLIITYRELRLLEIQILKELNKYGEMAADISTIVWVDVDRFYGIEYDEFAARIAEVAMWLIDHQMNTLVSAEFGQYFVRLPLKKAANIVHGNALRIDWESVVSKDELHFIIGNPPFIGAKFMNDAQRRDVEFVMFDVPNYGLLDYVCCWHIKASRFIQNSSITVAFVSTNSITQGEQVAPLWNYLLSKNITIHFAYRTFVWDNEARGKAAVHCVIIGFAAFESKNKRIYLAVNKDTVEVVPASNINPYLVDAKNILIPNRQKPLCNVPEIATGNKPIDGGNYIFLEQEKEDFLKAEPSAEKYILPFLGAEEFINSKKRWILFLKNANPSELKSMPAVLQRIEAVRKFRDASSSLPTKKLASTPTRFHTENMPSSPYLVIPQVSSERRMYIPIGYIIPPVVCSDKLRIMPDASLYAFGVMTSMMHMAWTKAITGRLKSDFQYSVLNVYNNFPWAENPTEKQIKAVEDAAQKVLDARAEFPNSSLADLYDPLTMPPALVKAHQSLDKAVDLCYRSQPFTSEMNRMEFLFALYEQYTAPLLKEDKKKKKSVVSTE